MFEENNLVNETENVELTTEQTAGVEETTEQTEVVETPKTYTEEELNARVDELLAKKIARKEARIRKEYDKKYGKLESVLKAGTGEEDLDKLTNTFTDFYTKKGIQIPTEPTYYDYDMKAGAEKEANEIINSGFDRDTVEWVVNQYNKTAYKREQMPKVLCVD